MHNAHATICLWWFVLYVLARSSKPLVAWGVQKQAVCYPADVSSHFCYVWSSFLHAKLCEPLSFRQQSHSIAHQHSIVIVQFRGLRAILWLEAARDLTLAMSFCCLCLKAATRAHLQNIWEHHLWHPHLPTWRQVIYTSHLNSNISLILWCIDFPAWLPEAEEQWVQKSMSFSPVP